MLHDITPPITEALAVWPGDTKPSREVLLDMARGDNLTLSTLHGTVHLGAHADGANHYGKDAASIDEHALSRYLGKCQVQHVSVERGTRVCEGDLTAPIEAERLLIATHTYPDPTEFNEDFAGLDPALVDSLAKSGVQLVGIDTPSVDLFESKDLPAHQAFLRNDMVILEGLVLAGVTDGIYELIALPLRLVGFDASPVRAVLREY